MISLGLVGYPLSHSYSPVLHKSALDAFALEGEYKLFPVEPGDNDGLIQLVKNVRVWSVERPECHYSLQADYHPIVG